MKAHSRIDAMLKPLAILGSALCALGVAVTLFVILVRIPAMASSKLELLLGTLQGVAVGLLFAITALLIHLTYMLRRATRPILVPSAGDGRTDG